MRLGLEFVMTFLSIVVVPLLYALPIIAVIWVIATLGRVRTDQEEILRRLTAIERRLADRSARTP
jgi:sensor domain CHASE-containing protein